MGKNFISSSLFEDLYKKYIQEYLISSNAVRSFDSASYFHHRIDWCSPTGVFAIHPYNSKTSSKIYCKRQTKR